MKTAIALGTFDGVHIGHRAVINAAVNSGFKAIAVAFPEPPRGIISGEKSILTSASRKKEILKKQGIEEVYYLDFAKIKDTSPRDFLEFLKEEFDPAVIVCGFNYRFGKNGEGNTAAITEFCLQNGIEFVKAKPVISGGRAVSSTRIRQLLKVGRVTAANALLCEPFGFQAPIIHGDERGRTIGFPTVNQVYPANAARVKFGVYKTRVTVEDKTYSGVTNIGVRPTFKNGLISAETHIIGFSGEIYGKLADIRLLKFIRAERKFTSVEHLKENIENDLKKAR